jgi:tetratricopeptide (TPR) repeat protein
MGGSVPLAIRQILVLPAVLLPALAAGSPSFAQTAPARPPKRAPEAGAAAATRPESPGVSFEEASRRAAAGRDGGDASEAIRWYREGVRLRPSWDEGWWYLGALSYERGAGAQAARAFARFVALKPDSGPGWALRGLSEFQTRDYAASMRHLARGLSLGSVGNAEIRDAVYYHMAVLRIRASQFELAVEPLSALARVKTETPALVGACGVFLLRMPLLPEDVPEERRELVLAAGRAAFAALGLKADASQRFEEALVRHPDTPNLHYGYGGYLLQQGEEHASAALDQFRREMKVNPSSVYAPLEIAFELLKRGEHAEALPYAESAVRIAPGLFAGHHALGRALLETGAVPGAVRELEEAVRLAPQSPEMRATLARAYVMAGRRDDAEKVREVYKRLQLDRETVRLPGFAREDTIGREAKTP